MQETSFKKDLLVDFIQMTVLFIASIIVVYKSNHLISGIFFIIPLILAFKSKKDYFWFAFFFILINAPASFFLNRSMEAVYRLPFYSVMSQFSFTPMDLFLFISIYKGYRSKVKVKFFLNKPLEFFLIYLLIISIPVSFILGTDIKAFVNTLRSFFFFGIIFSYLRLIRNKEDLYKFGYLMVPFVILIFFDQFYVINQGSRFISNFDPTMLGIYVRNSISGDIRAVMQGVLIVFYALIFGYQINNNKKYELFPGFSSVIIFLAMGSFILSATRAWITIGMITLIGYIFLYPNGIKFAIKIGVVSVLLFIALMSAKVVEVQFLETIYERYAVLGNVATSGNLSESDTFTDRIEHDIPLVMKGIEYSPIFGVGLSRLMATYYSNDVGFINTILIYGVIGFFVFLFFISRYLFNLFRLKKNDDFGVDEKNILISVILALMGMMTGYFFTWDFFSFYPEKIFFVSLIFATGDLILEFQTRETITPIEK